MITPDKIRSKAEQLNALLFAFETAYLKFLDIGTEFDSPTECREREHGAAAFFAVREMLEELTEDMEVLRGNLIVCDAILALEKAREEK